MCWLFFNRAAQTSELNGPEMPTLPVRLPREDTRGKASTLPASTKMSDLNGNKFGLDLNVQPNKVARKFEICWLEKSVAP